MLAIVGDSCARKIQEPSGRCAHTKAEPCCPGHNHGAKCQHDREDGSRACGDQYGRHGQHRPRDDLRDYRRTEAAEPSEQPYHDKGFADQSNPHARIEKPATVIDIRQCGHCLDNHAWAALYTTAPINNATVLRDQSGNGMTASATSDRFVVDLSDNEFLYQMANVRR